MLASGGFFVYCTLRRGTFGSLPETGTVLRLSSKACFLFAYVIFFLIIFHSVCSPGGFLSLFFSLSFRHLFLAFLFLLLLWPLLSGLDISHASAYRTCLCCSLKGKFLVIGYMDKRLWWVGYSVLGSIGLSCHVTAEPKGSEVKEGRSQQCYLLHSIDRLVISYGTSLLVSQTNTLSEEENEGTVGEGR